ncbi:NAD(P)/FAD-dependent oxidoreductase [Phenylobacterium immobile]|uniref:NAD(P)/FAD-dependent oxidoreductase n=1 Tax=Phenylobacterium immobile TaxID=21 RepID=UPI000A84844F|nr:NAD(P)/FAD-dependent oxidoreductase [Phenylobacterium immobile]
MADFDFDAVVVGAGAVGLACGYALARRGLIVAVLEKDAAIGQGVSSRNSEVIHAGLQYPTGSLKARLCVEGRRALYAFLDAHHVDYARCGKLVAATKPEQLEGLRALLRRAQANGVEDVIELSAAEAIALEPELFCVGALSSPQSGVFDSHGYMLALEGEIEAAGGTVVLATPFEAARPLADGGFEIQAGGEQPTTLTCRYLVTAPGLSAQGVAAHIAGFPAAEIPEPHYGKGMYFRLAGKPPFSRLIYPPPGHGSVGAHYRTDLGGQGVIGPDLHYVDHPDYTVDASAEAEFSAYIRTFWPGLPDGALTPDYAGVRPKLHGPDEPQPDFRLDGPDMHGLAGLVALFGIESPGLTASLAIGEEVALRLGL